MTNTTAAPRHLAPAAHRTVLADRGGYEAMVVVLEQVRRIGGPAAVADALTEAHRRLMRPGLEGLRHQITEDLIAESSRTGRHNDTLVGLLCRGVDLILEGDVRAARCLTELRGRLADHDDPVVRFVVRAIEVMFDIRAGRLGSAERGAARCAWAGAAAGHPAAARWYGSHLIVIRWYQGRVAELLPMIRKLAAAASASPVDYSYQSALAVAAAVAGERAEAVDALVAFDEHGLSALPPSASSLVTLYGVVEAAHLLDARQTAAAAYELLRPYAGRSVTAGPAIACLGSVEHALGLAKLTLGDLDASVGHLRNAVRDNLALGHWPAATLARHRLALALAAGGGPGNRTLARQEAESARRDALDLGVHLPDGPAPATVRHGAVDRPATPSCRRDGRGWQVLAAGRVTTVAHCRGMTYLAVLLANPGREIPAGDLATGTGIPPGPADQPAPDPGTLERYRHRLRRLQQDIERCDRIGDPQAAILAHAERDRLLAELGAAAGPADRVHSSGTDRERARISVGKALRRALRRIADADRDVGDLLSAGIRTGHRCAYLPG